MPFEKKPASWKIKLTTMINVLGSTHDFAVRHVLQLLPELCLLLQHPLHLCPQPRNLCVGARPGSVQLLLQDLALGLEGRDLALEEGVGRGGDGRQLDLWKLTVVTGLFCQETIRKCSKEICVYA